MLLPEPSVPEGADGGPLAQVSSTQAQQEAKPVPKADLRNCSFSWASQAAGGWELNTWDLECCGVCSLRAVPL